MKICRTHRYLSISFKHPLKTLEKYFSGIWSGTMKKPLKIVFRDNRLSERRRCDCF
nr:MAG TPA: hypothetical protein [Bacteriophage sp.]